MPTIISTQTHKPLPVLAPSQTHSLLFPLGSSPNLTPLSVTPEPEDLDSFEPSSTSLSSIDMESNGNPLDWWDTIHSELVKPDALAPNTPDVQNLDWEVLSPPDSLQELEDFLDAQHPSQESVNPAIGSNSYSSAKNPFQTTTNHEDQAGKQYVDRL